MDVLLPKKYKHQLITFQHRHPNVFPCFLISFLLTPTLFFILIYIFLSCSTNEFPANNLPHWISSRVAPIKAIPFKQNLGYLNENKRDSSTISSSTLSNYDEINDALIFVSIASFRDPECANTILQIFEQAKNPDRIRVGIFQQNNFTEPDCNDFRHVLNCDPKHHDYSYIYKSVYNNTIKNENNNGDNNNNGNNNNNNNNNKDKQYRHIPSENVRHILCGRQWQIKIDRINWEESLGPTYGRYRTELFYDNEDYLLQMDSHTALAAEWDTELIAMHKSLNNDFGVITTYPRPLRNPTLWTWQAPDVQKYTSHHKETNSMYVICSTQILKDKVTKSFKLTPAKIIKNTQRPILTAFFAAGFSFQKGHRIVNVPNDPYAAYLFDGEEMSMAIRMWTHGYDFYAPHKDIAYHLYSPNDAKIRPVFWEHDWKTKWKIARESEYRINYIMGVHEQFTPHIPWTSIDLRESEKYGCGNERSTSEFWKFTRISLENLTSDDLCDVYSQGGMERYRVAWKNRQNDPYLLARGLV